MSFCHCTCESGTCAQEYRPQEAPPAKRPAEVVAQAGAPNVVVVLLDDVGFAAASTFGGPVATPHLDRLARDGLRYNRFHTTSMCSPRRASLLTGRNPHAINMGTLADSPDSRPGYSYLNTKLQEVQDVSLPPDVIYNRIRPLPVGSDLPFSVPHQLTGSVTYELPSDPSVGTMSISGTVVHQSSWFNSSDGDETDDFFIGIVPKYTFVNANLTWKEIGGGPVDATFFVTNLTN